MWYFIMWFLCIWWAVFYHIKIDGADELSLGAFVGMVILNCVWPILLIFYGVEILSKIDRKDIMLYKDGVWFPKNKEDRS